MNQRLHALVLAAALLLPGLAWARATPEQVTLQYFQAIQSQGFAVAPRYIHPQEQARFKAMLLPLFELKEAGPNLSKALFGQAKTVAEIQAMEPQAFMESVLKVMGAHMRQAQMELGEMAIIGTVKEGAIVHVVVRASTGNADTRVTRMSVVSLMPEGDGWKLMLTGSMEGLAQAFKARLGPKAR